MQRARAAATDLPPLRHDRVRGVALRLAAITGFSAMAATIKLAYEHGVSTPEAMFYRSFFALPIILGWIVAGRHWGVWRTKRPGAHAMRGIVGLLSMALGFSALGLLPLAEATTISFAAPLFALALSAPFLGERVGAGRWLAVFAGFAGVVIVMQPGGTLPLLGTGVALGAAAGVACVTVMLRSISRTEGTLTTVFWFTIFSIVVTGMLMPWVGQWHDTRTWLLLLTIGLTGGVGQLCLTASLRYAPIATLAPIDYAQLIYAVLLGWALWGAQPAWTTWAGAAVIIASVLSTFRMRRRSDPLDPASPAVGEA